jgi:hypothetical protein
MRQTDGLKDTLKLIFETSLLPKYNIFKSKMLKEEITLEIKIQFHKKFQLFLTNHKYCYICHVLSLFVAIATNFFKIGKKDNTCIISRLPSTHMSHFIKMFPVLFEYHWIQFMCKIWHIFSLFVAIATRIFNIGRKEKA